MTMPMIRTGADYNPNRWKLGYQSRQFGVAENSKPSGVTDTGSVGSTGETYAPCQLFGDGMPSDVSASMANPPAAMITAATEALDQAIAVTPTQ